MLNTLMRDNDVVEVEQVLERRRRGFTDSQIGLWRAEELANQSDDPWHFYHLCLS
jgi:hypothetical protein